MPPAHLVRVKQPPTPRCRICEDRREWHEDYLSARHQRYRDRRRFEEMLREARRGHICTDCNRDAASCSYVRKGTGWVFFSDDDKRIELCDCILALWKERRFGERCYCSDCVEWERWIDSTFYPGRECDCVDCRRKRWHGKRWHGDRWHGDRWHGDRWHEDRWQEDRWQRDTWEGDKWKGERW